jgi:hypothetical protein
MLNIYAENRYNEAKEFATKTGQLESFNKVFEAMEKRAENANVNIYEDFAPLSFYFTVNRKDDNSLISNGGIIYHGKHDGNGNGGAPTFSVCIDPTTGWKIHT